LLNALMSRVVKFRRNYHFKHVRAIPWPSGRWRARRRIDTGYAGRLHGREHTQGHVQSRCRGGGGVGPGKGCRLRRRSGGGPPAWYNASGRGRHTTAQRTCARPRRRTGGRVGSTAARRDASNRTGRWRQQLQTRRRNKPAHRHDHPRVIVGASNPGSRCARSPRATRGGWGGQGGRRPVTPVTGQSF